MILTKRYQTPKIMYIKSWPKSSSALTLEFTLYLYSKTHNKLDCFVLSYINQSVSFE